MAGPIVPDCFAGVDLGDDPHVMADQIVPDPVESDVARQVSGAGR